METQQYRYLVSFPFPHWCGNMLNSTRKEVLKILGIGGIPSPNMKEEHITFSYIESPIPLDLQDLIDRIGTALDNQRPVQFSFEGFRWFGTRYIVLSVACSEELSKLHKRLAQLPSDVRCKGEHDDDNTLHWTIVKLSRSLLSSVTGNLNQVKQLPVPDDEISIDSLKLYYRGPLDEEWRCEKEFTLTPTKT